MRLQVSDGAGLAGWVVEDDHFISESKLGGYNRHLHFHRDMGGMTGIDISWLDEVAPVYGERLVTAISTSFWAAMTGAPLLEMETAEFHPDGWVHVELEPPAFPL